MQITGEKAVGEILTAMLLKYPSARIVLTLGKQVEESLRLASIASSLAVSKKGAVDSIPHLKKVLAAKLKELKQ